MVTPQVGKWYLTQEGKAVKIIAHDSWGWHGNNDEIYTRTGRVSDRWEHPEDLDLERGPIEPTAEELALYALGELWTSYDNAGGAAFQWSDKEVSAVKEALAKAGRLGSQLTIAL